jgi:hypothetical protein
MTDTLLDYDPNDSGGITRLPGETRIRIDTADLHSDETGERTQNLGRYAIHASVVGAIPRKVIDLDDTVTFHIPETIGVVADTQTLTLLGSLTATPGGELRPAAPGPRPTGPLPPTPPPTPPSKYDDPAETGVNIFGGLGEHLPEGPDNYVGRHRHPEGLAPVEDVAPAVVGQYWEMRRPAHERRPSPWWALGAAVAAGLAIWAGLILAAVAVFW